MLLEEIIAKEQISAKELDFLINNYKNKIYILDVRSPLEYSSYHLKAASNFPIEDLSLLNVLNELNISPKDEEVILVTYCNAGGRGGRSFNMLKEENSKIANSQLLIKNLQHGINEWIDLGYKISK